MASIAKKKKKESRDAWVRSTKCGDLYVCVCVCWMQGDRARGCLLATTFLARHFFNIAVKEGKPHFFFLKGVCCLSLSLSLSVCCKTAAWLQNKVQKCVQLSSRILFTAVVVFEILYNSLAGAYIHTYLHTDRQDTRAQAYFHRAFFFFSNRSGDGCFFFFFRTRACVLLRLFSFPLYCEFNNKNESSWPAVFFFCVCH